MIKIVRIEVSVVCILTSQHLCTSQDTDRNGYHLLHWEGSVFWEGMSLATVLSAVSQIWLRGARRAVSSRQLGEVQADVRSQQQGAVSA